MWSSSCEITVSSLRSAYNGDFLVRVEHQVLDEVKKRLNRLLVRACARQDLALHGPVRHLLRRVQELLRLLLVVVRVVDDQLRHVHFLLEVAQDLHERIARAELRVRVAAAAAALAHHFLEQALQEVDAAQHALVLPGQTRAHLPPSGWRSRAGCRYSAPPGSRCRPGSR